MSNETRIDDDGATPIPAEFREEYELHPGTTLVWEQREEGLLVRKRRNAARGLLADGLDEQVRKRVAEELTTEIRNLRRRTEFDRSDTGESARGEQT